MTEKLDNLIVDSEKKYWPMKSKSEPYRTKKFYDLVREGGEYDLKNKPEWKGEDRYIYNGEVVKRDVPGNIHYEHLGKVFGYSDEVLKAGAGAYQMWQDPRQIKNFNWDTYGDDPRDTERIRQGIDIYRRRR